MFTFYDDTYGVQECVWNLCWNEQLITFVTFYSWVPSFMANINNIPFSFDRNTSKWIAKLGQSHSENSFADGITCDNVVIRKNLLTNDQQWYDLGKLTLSNRVLPEGLDYIIEFTKGDYDPFRTLQYIELDKQEDGYHLLVNANRLWELKSELYYRNSQPTHVYPDWDNYKDKHTTENPEEYFEAVEELPIFINRNHKRLCRPRNNSVDK